MATDPALGRQASASTTSCPPWTITACASLLQALACAMRYTKLHIATDIPEVVTGSLCHDLGSSGRRKIGSQEECLRQHPADSVEPPAKAGGELSDESEDAISRHMWPFAGSKPPNSLEGAIVSTADKIATFEDYAEAIRRKAAEKPWHRRER